ncbi:MAG TPA: glycosyltransferase [Terracidiphilus sp.]|nr:glycosyltransferase [Terracidiphilus sp.]
MKDEELLIEIVSRNRGAKLMQALAECVRLGFPRIFVVDSGSTDRTREYLQELGSVEMVMASTNEGGSGGFQFVSKQFINDSDDTSYALSASQKAGRIQYCPSLVMIHDCSRSSRRPTHHSAMRLEKEIVNKIVLIREYSRFKRTYIALSVIRQQLLNPTRMLGILRFYYLGLKADLTAYRNHAV